MNSDAYRAYWSAWGDLIKWHRDPRIVLSPSADTALFSLGFPAAEMHEFAMRNPIQLVGDGIRCFATYNEFGKIATLDGEAVICTDETMTGVYVNESVLMFLFSITIIHRNLNRVGDKEYDQAVMRTRRELMDLDYTAFASDGSFWPLYFTSYGFRESKDA